MLAALRETVPTKRWAIAEPDASGADVFDVYRSPGWFHVLPRELSMSGFLQDATVLKRLARKVDAHVLSTMVLDSDLATTTLVTRDGTREILASGQPDGYPRIGRARPKTPAWGELLVDGVAAAQLGKALRRGSRIVDDDLTAALGLLGLPESVALGDRTELGRLEGSIRVVELGGGAGSSSGPSFVTFNPLLTGVAGGQVTGELVVRQWNRPDDELALGVSGGAIDSGLLEDVVVDVDRRVSVYDEGTNVDYVATVTASAKVAGCGTVAFHATDPRGVTYGALVPVSVKRMRADGWPWSVRNAWVTVRFAPLTSAEEAFRLVSAWFGTPGIVDATESGPKPPEARLKVSMLFGEDIRFASRTYRLAGLVDDRRWRRFAGEFADANSVGGVAEPRAGRNQGGTTFDYLAAPGYGVRDVVAREEFTPRLRLTLDRAYVAPDAERTAMTAVSGLLDDCVAAGLAVQAVAGLSATDDTDHYRAGDMWRERMQDPSAPQSTADMWAQYGLRLSHELLDVAGARRALWSAGHTAWFGQELWARVDQVRLAEIADIEVLGGGARATLHPGVEPESLGVAVPMVPIVDMLFDEHQQRSFRGDENLPPELDRWLRQYQSR